MEHGLIFQLVHYMVLNVMRLGVISIEIELI